MNFSLKAFKLCCFVFKVRFTTLVVFLQKRARVRCDFSSLSLQAITKIMKTKEKNKACIFKERSTLCKEYGKFVNTRQEAVQFCAI